MTWVSPSSGATGRTSPPPSSTGSQPEAFASPTSTRPPSARPRGHACSPAGTTTEAPWAGWRTWRWASPATGHAPKENGYLSEILRASGYATYAVGKWHLSPEDETNNAASRSTWPLGRGFDRWYGFHGGETHQFVPALISDNHSVRPPQRIDEGYHLSADLADRSIEFLGDLRAVDAERPFFLYLCPGACHSPHQAPREWIERERGRFDMGWDEWREQAHQRQLELGIVPEGTALAPRPPWVRAWDDLDAPERAVAARFMSASPPSCPTPTRSWVGCSASWRTSGSSTTRS